MFPRSTNSQSTPRADGRKLISIVMPAMNEEANLPRAYAELTTVLSSLPYDYEVLVMDNDSQDATGAVAEDLCHQDSRWKYVKLSRNFTVEVSMAAGLRLARGDAAILIFSDLQDPPTLIKDFVAKWEAGNDVVYGVLNQRGGDPLWRSWAAKLAYKVIHAMADVEITPNATDYRLLSRRAIDAINQFNERNRYLRGYAHWIGFKQCAVPYDRRARTKGKSKAPLFYLLNFAVNAITCFSIKPLQLLSACGAVALLGTVVLAFVYVICYILDLNIRGLTTMYILLLANLAVMLVGLGTLGEYIGRIYVEIKQRPLFLIDKTVNLEGADAIRMPTARSMPHVATYTRQDKGEEEMPVAA